MADTKLSNLTAIPAVDNADLIYIVDNTDTSSKKVTVGSLATHFATENDQNAAEVEYDNASSGLTATDVQAAVDEVEGRVDTLESGSSAGVESQARFFDDFMDDGSQISPTFDNHREWSTAMDQTSGVGFGTHAGLPSGSVFSGTVRQYVAALDDISVMTAGEGICQLGLGNVSYTTRVFIDTLATATEDYTYFTGVDHVGGRLAIISDYIGFAYDRSTSNNWLCISADGSTQELTNSGVAVAAGSWVKLKWEYDSVAGDVTFYIDDVQVGTNSTNLPASTEVLEIDLAAHKTATSSNTNIFIYTDYVDLIQTLNRAP